MNDVKKVLQELMVLHPEYQEALNAAANVYDCPLDEFMKREAVFRLEEIHGLILQEHALIDLADDVYTEYWNSDFFLDYDHIDHLTVETIKEHATEAKSEEQILKVLNEKGIFWLSTISTKHIEDIVRVSMNYLQCDSQQIFKKIMDELEFTEFVSALKLISMIENA